MNGFRSGASGTGFSGPNPCSFIKRFSEDVRYMHIVNTAKLKDGALLAVWQESPGVIPRQDAAYNWTVATPSPVNCAAYRST